jgi:NAD(P)-dependent dehydrogenase (short-subunit alcohol dehydrogenase family)
MSDTRNRVAIITGASSGIGAAVAKRAASEGYNVLLGYRSKHEEAQSVVAECESQGVAAIAQSGDIADDKVCRDLASVAEQEWGRIDVLVNNAGASVFCAHGDLEGVGAETFQKLYQINTVGAFQVIRAVAPVMKAGGGRIVNVASVAGVFGVGSSLPYACSKAAMLALNKSMARELGPEILVNAVCPGMVAGDWLLNGLGEELYREVEKRHKGMAPTGEIMTPETVADSIWFFASAASNVTGEQLILDGGVNLRY